MMIVNVYMDVSREVINDARTKNPVIIQTLNK